MEGKVTARELEQLDYLIKKAKTVRMTPEEETKQRRSFAYGNSAFENPLITRTMIDEEAEKLGL
jgi:uncharacterized protein YnzC (UPF0291/DUF896 family)